jgi:IS5 family transposase
MKQMTLSSVSFDRCSKTMRRAAFLAEMDRVVPWSTLCVLVEPVYSKAGNGGPSVDIERMLRIYFLQNWFSLSDPAMEEALYESLSMREFVGIDLGKRLFEEGVGRHLQTKGLSVSTGIIVDATIIKAPSTIKNQSRARLGDASNQEGQPVVLRYEGPHRGGQQGQVDPFDCGATCQHA